MKTSRLSQKIHKWLGLLVGIQLVIWTISGFYMVVIDIDIIHGDHLVQPAAELSAESVREFSTKLPQLTRTYPEAQSLSLESLAGRAVFKVKTPSGTLLLDALNGETITAIDNSRINQLANIYYAGSGVIQNATLIESNPPREIGARPLPIWRIDFDDIWGTTLYISPITGALATRRHTLWRVFDFVWMLHIMDYDEREDINNILLRIVSILAFLLVLSGIWYLYFRLNVKSWFSKVSS
ncbi:MAG: putative iron-regulated membrane protein [Arenicella sp.]